MTKFTEQDVITFIKEKIAALTAELERTQRTLQALTGSSKPTEKAPAPIPVKRAYTKRNKQPITQTPILPPPTPPKPIEGLEDHVLALLTKRPTYIADLVLASQRLHTDTDAQKVENEVMNTLFALKKKGIITGVQEGKKIKYSVINSF